MPPLLRYLIKALLNAVLSVIGRGRIILHDSFFTRQMELRLSLKTRGAILPCTAPNADNESPPINRVSRLALRELLAAPQGFEALLAKLLPQDIPVCFVEGYAATKAAAQRYPAAPRAIFSANSWAYDEVFKQWAGRNAGRGTLLLGAQHGGGYFGIGTIFPFLDWEFSIVDRYYTWGWTPAGPTALKARPMSSTLLSSNPETPADNGKSGILYVGTAEPRYLLSLQNPIGLFAKYLDWQQRFLRISPDSVKRALLVRLYAEDYGWDIRERWQTAAPATRFDDANRPFLDSLKSCRLYVCDHLGTTFYQAMAANRPSILFFDPELNPMLPEGQHAFDKLREAGIVFDSPEAAAAAIALRHDDVETWWNSVPIQTARLVFCAGYAKTSSTIIEEYSAELLNILN